MSVATLRILYCDARTADDCAATYTEPIQGERGQTGAELRRDNGFHKAGTTPWHDKADICDPCRQAGARTGTGLLR